jgi:hypothetical protein
MAQVTYNASSDHISIYKQSGSYPPVGSVQENPSDLLLFKQLATGLYKIDVYLVRFLTSLPANARIISASLDFKQSGLLNADNRNVQGEWYALFDGTLDTTDYTDAVGSSAFNVALSAISSAIALSNLTNIPLNGYAALRCQISGNIPSGKNGFVTGSSPLPALTIVYTQLQQPTIISPLSGAFALNSAITFQWQHNDDSGSPQVKYLFEYSTNGGSSWTQVSMNSPNQSHTLAANTFSAGQTVLWRVTTYSESDSTIASPVSNQGSITIGAAVTAPTITAPTGSSVSNSLPPVTWTSGVGTRTAWRARIRKQSDGLLVGANDSGETAGTVLTWTPTTALANATAYWAEVQIKDSTGVWSPWAQSAFTTAFNPPPAPTNVTATEQSSQGRIKISHTVPAPGGGQDAAITVNISRDDVVIVEGWTKGADYYDYECVSGVTHSYKVISVAANGSKTSSSAATAEAVWAGFMIHDKADTSTMMNIKAYKGAFSEDEEYEEDYVEYEGRELPVALEGEHKAQAFDAIFSLLKQDQQLVAYRTLMRRRGTLVVRVYDGYKIIGKSKGFKRAWKFDTPFEYGIALHIEGTEES